MGSISHIFMKMTAGVLQKPVSAVRILFSLCLLVMVQSCTLLDQEMPANDAPDEGPADLANVSWIFGEQDCEAAQSDPEYMEWQQVRYQQDTWIFRQNKCSDYEGPFVYLLTGMERALLIDTGATVAGGDSLLKMVRGITSLPLTVAHSHGHGDHTQGDSAFANAADAVVVGHGAEAVTEFFGFENWPNQAVQFELGNRSLEILPVPGHTVDDLAFYDPNTSIVITGDSLYPGRLYVRDWDGFRASIARLKDWLQSRQVSYVLGTHIEMSAVPDRDYPVGTTYQPNERQLPLSASDIVRLHEALLSEAEPERLYLESFIVWPVN